MILFVIMNSGYMLFQALLVGEGFLTNVAGGHVLLRGVLGPTKPNISYSADFLASICQNSRLYLFPFEP